MSPQEIIEWHATDYASVLRNPRHPKWWVCCGVGERTSGLHRLEVANSASRLRPQAQQVIGSLRNWRCYLWKSSIGTRLTMHPRQGTTTPNGVGPLKNKWRTIDQKSSRWVEQTCDRSRPNKHLPDKGKLAIKKQTFSGLTLPAV